MTSRGSLSFLISKRWLGYWALFLIFSVSCVLLGNWQFDRRAQAQAEIARIDQNYDAPAVPLEGVVPARTDFSEADHKWQQVIVTGRYLDQVFLVRNRPYQSQVGYEILAPLQLNDGSVFIVNRGWLPLSETADGEVKIPQPPQGQVEVTARLKAGEPLIADRSAAANTVGTIHLPELQELLDAPTYTGAYGLLVSETPDAAHGELALRPERDEGPHLSYALQWYVFIAVAGVGLFFGARSEYRSGIARDNLETVPASAQPSGTRAARRRSDADDEDALLDAFEAGKS